MLIIYLHEDKSEKSIKLFHIIVRTGAYTCGHEPSEMSYKVRNLKGFIAL